MQTEIIPATIICAEPAVILTGTCYILATTNKIKFNSSAKMGLLTLRQACYQENHTYFLDELTKWAENKVEEYPRVPLDQLLESIDRDFGESKKFAGALHIVTSHSHV